MTPAQGMNQVVASLWVQLQAGWDAWMKSKPIGVDGQLRDLDRRIRDLDSRLRADVLAGRLSLERWHGIAEAIADGISFATGLSNSTRPVLERFWSEVVVETGKDVAKVAAIGLPVVVLVAGALAVAYLYSIRRNLL